jgi:hypothetical protein
LSEKARFLPVYLPAAAALALTLQHHFPFELSTDPRTLSMSLPVAMLKCC